MLTSQNGYPANRRDLIASHVVPGTEVRVSLRRGPCAEVLLWFASRFDAVVEDLDTARSHDEDPRPDIPDGGPSGVPDDWGYAERPIRGSTTTLSNHASGTALDLNATQHPLGISGTFTAEQVARIHGLLAECVDPVTGRCVLRWGGDYEGRKDPMHVEIVAPEDAVERVAKRLEDDVRPEDIQAIAEKTARMVATGIDPVKVDDPPNPDNPEWTIAGTLRWLVEQQRRSTAREKAFAESMAELQSMAADLRAIRAGLSK